MADSLDRESEPDRSSRIHIRSKKFWQDSLAVIGQKIDQYCELYP